jgi:hypothetical protein
MKFSRDLCDLKTCSPFDGVQSDQKKKNLWLWKHAINLPCKSINFGALDQKKKWRVRYGMETPANREWGDNLSRQRPPDRTAAMSWNRISFLSQLASPLPAIPPTVSQQQVFPPNLQRPPIPSPSDLIKKKKKV